MPYPVQNLNSTGAVSATSTAAAPQTGSSAIPTLPSPVVDSAEVAKTAALLTSITEMASNIPAIDQALVADLQQAISSGAVEANPQQIAKSIVELGALLASTGGGEDQ